MNKFTNAYLSDHRRECTDFKPVMEGRTEPRNACGSQRQLVKGLWSKAAEHLNLGRIHPGPPTPTQCPHLPTPGNGLPVEARRGEPRRSSGAQQKPGSPGQG